MVAWGALQGLDGVWPVVFGGVVRVRFDDGEFVKF